MSQAHDLRDHNEEPIRLGGGSIVKWPDFGPRGLPLPKLRDRALREALLSLPAGVYEGANRYDTDDEHVLHLWRDGKSWDVRLSRVGLAEPPETPDQEVQLDPDVWYAAFETVSGEGARTPEGRADIYRRFREAYLVAWGRRFLAEPTEAER